MVAWGRMAALAVGLAAQGAWAQDEGSVELRLGGEDHIFVVLGKEAGTAIEGPDEGRTVTLVAAPEAGGDEADRLPRLTVAFLVEGVGNDATLSEPRILFEDAEGRRYRPSEGMTGTVTLDSITEIGGSVILSGEFSAELSREEGGGGPLGASGDFQTTFETE